MRLKIDTKYFLSSINTDDIEPFDPEVDDSPIGVINNICEYLEDQDACSFVVQGFGQEIWPTDIDTDFAVFLSQIPAALLAIDERKKFSIDFYEQGLERFLSFFPNGDRWEVECKVTYDNWIPAPSKIMVDNDDLKRMLEKALNDFLTLVKPIRYDPVWKKLFDEWLSGSDI